MKNLALNVKETKELVPNAQLEWSYLMDTVLITVSKVLTWEPTELARNVPKVAPSVNQPPNVATVKLVTPSTQTESVPKNPTCQPVPEDNS